jgi:hypothetical protein
LLPAPEGVAGWARDAVSRSAALRGGGGRSDPLAARRRSAGWLPSRRCRPPRRSVLPGRRSTVGSLSLRRGGALSTRCVPGVARLPRKVGTRLVDDLSRCAPAPPSRSPSVWLRSRAWGAKPLRFALALPRSRGSVSGPLRRVRTPGTAPLQPKLARVGPPLRCARAPKDPVARLRPLPAEAGWRWRVLFLDLASQVLSKPPFRARWRTSVCRGGGCRGPSPRGRSVGVCCRGGEIADPQKSLFTSKSVP